MVPWRATLAGEVNDDVIAWYRRFAQGKPGAIVVEATGVRDIASGPLLRISHDRFVSGLSRLVEAVRQGSGGETRLFIQLIDFLAIRRRPAADRYFREFLRILARHRQAVADRLHCAIEQVDETLVRSTLSAAPDDVLRCLLSPREYEDLMVGARERIDDLHNPEIAALPSRLPPCFAAATLRAQQAGFDGVELHFAHAYTMASFLSATNRRTDGYGQTIAGRLAVPLAVVQAARAVAQPDFVVGLRMLSSECIDGGTTIDDSCTIAVALAQAGADFISLSRGGKFDDALQPKVGQAAYPYTGPSGYECMPTVYSDARGPFGRNFADAKRVRQALRDAGLPTPVVVAGGICSYEQMQGVLAEEIGDVVASARQTLADPDWFLKLERGHGAAIRRCEYTNYCEALDQQHKVVTCKLWDRVDLDQPGVTLTADGRRRTVAPVWAEPEVVDPSGQT